MIVHLQVRLIGRGRPKMAYNVEALEKKGHLEHKCSTLAQCLIVVQKFNLQRQAPFLPMQC
jgi:hypothetical protein